MMKKQMILLALLLGVLSGCAAKQPEPETAEPVQETVTEVQEEAPEEETPDYPEGFCEYEQTLCYFDGTSAEPVSFTPGSAEIEGKDYLIEDDGRSICRTTGELLVRSSGTYYLNEDFTLETFPEGILSLNDALYYNLEAGESLCTPEPGLFRKDGELYFVQEDGSLLCDAEQGYLFFGSDGAYTSGSETLDDGIAALMESCGAFEEEDRETALRLCFNSVRDDFKYLSMEHYAAGSTDWAQTAAETFLELGKGNCYCFAATFMYCARQLGYDAYVVAGWESNATNDHAWVMIDWEDGTTYLFDPQLEYAYLYQFQKAPVDMFKQPGDGHTYNHFAYFFP